MKSPGIEEKVQFLSRPEAYSGHVSRVELKQTHMSWVFLTDAHAWKLKKPVRTEYSDFSTVEARRRNAARELRLNRRLAKDVYLGIVAITLEAGGNLRLGGNGEAVDWLVLMRRLPADRMLDYMISQNVISKEDVDRVSAVLADFYKKLPAASVTGFTYRERLAIDLEKALQQLMFTGDPLLVRLVQPLVESELEFLRKNPGLFDKRVAAGKIVQCHGDLRPEHICLEPAPVVIDCLEFNRSLRTLDIASELCFLALECERLGAPEIGNALLKTYVEITGDSPSPELLAFYRTYHACIRAKLAVSHLSDYTVERRKWIDKAKQYLQMATLTDRAA